MDEKQLNEIEARAKGAMVNTWNMPRLMSIDVPALIAEIRRLWKMERLRLEANNRDLERQREVERTAELLRRENAALNGRILGLEAALKAAQAATEGE